MHLTVRSGVRSLLSQYSSLYFSSPQISLSHPMSIMPPLSKQLPNLLLLLPRPSLPLPHSQCHQHGCRCTCRQQGRVHAMAKWGRRATWSMMTWAVTGQRPHRGGGGDDGMWQASPPPLRPFPPPQRNGKIRHCPSSSPPLPTNARECPDPTPPLFLSPFQLALKGSQIQSRPSPPSAWEWPNLMSPSLAAPLLRHGPACGGTSPRWWVHVTPRRVDGLYFFSYLFILCFTSDAWK